MIKFLKRKSKSKSTETDSSSPSVAISSVELPPVEQIGVAAGHIWGALAENGELKLNQLVKRTPASRDIVMQAIGWLARENKVHITAVRKSQMISLVADEHARAA